MAVGELIAKLISIKIGSEFSHFPHQEHYPHKILTDKRAEPEDVFNSRSGKLQCAVASTAAISLHWNGL